MAHQDDDVFDLNFEICETDQIETFQWLDQAKLTGQSKQNTESSDEAYSIDKICPLLNQTIVTYLEIFESIRCYKNNIKKNGYMCWSS